MIETEMEPYYHSALFCNCNKAIFHNSVLIFILIYSIIGLLLDVNSLKGLPISLSKGGVASVSISISERGVVAVSVNISEGDVASES